MYSSQASAGRVPFANCSQSARRGSESECHHSSPARSSADGSRFGFVTIIAEQLSASRTSHPRAEVLGLQQPLFDREKAGEHHPAVCSAMPALFTELAICDGCMRRRLLEPGEHLPQGRSRHARAPRHFLGRSPAFQLQLQHLAHTAPRNPLRRRRPPPKGSDPKACEDALRRIPSGWRHRIGMEWRDNLETGWRHQPGIGIMPSIVDLTVHLRRSECPKPVSQL